MSFLKNVVTTIGVIGSLASIAGLLLYFQPNNDQYSVAETKESPKNIISYQEKNKNSTQEKRYKIVTINSNPRGAKLYINDVLYRKNSFSGEILYPPIRIFLEKGLHTVKITAHGYEDSIEKVDVNTDFSDKKLSIALRENENSTNNDSIFYSYLDKFDPIYSACGFREIESLSKFLKKDEIPNHPINYFSGEKPHSYWLALAIYRYLEKDYLNALDNIVILKRRIREECWSHFFEKEYFFKYMLVESWKKMPKIKLDKRMNHIFKEDFECTINHLYKEGSFVKLKRIKIGYFPEGILCNGEITYFDLVFERKR